MDKQEILKLNEKYFNVEGYEFPGHFEHRLDRFSSAIMYSLIRKYKPSVVLEIGSWKGGSTAVIMAALIKNKKPFTFICSELLDGLRDETKANVKQHCKKAPTMIGDITKNLDEIPKKLDFLFVDTSHDLETTKWIVKHIWPRVKRNGIFSMHDWPVHEVGKRIRTKEMDGIGECWEETRYLVGLYKKKKFPFTKIYWTYEGQGSPETGFWINT